MTEKITLGRAIVASIPIALWDLFVLDTMQMCIDRLFGCLIFPVEMLFVSGIVITFLWARYLARAYKEKKSVPP